MQYHVSSYKALRKWTQHCEPTTSNIVDVTCYVRLHTLLHVVAQNLKPVKLLATCKRTQQLPTLLANNVGSCARSLSAQVFTK